jgi:hypothetical protein
MEAQDRCVDCPQLGAQEGRYHSRFADYMVEIDFLNRDQRVTGPENSD